MNRLLFYIIAYIFSGILFFILSSWEFIDTVITGIFILVTLNFLFSREEKVEKTNQLKEPAVHYYHRSHINLYGYIMAAGGAAIAFLFYISTTSNIRPGPAAILLWAILIFLAYYASIYAGRRMFADAVVDYILMHQKTNMPYKRLDELIKAMIEAHTFDEQTLRDIIHKVEDTFNDFELTNKQEKEVVSLFTIYLEGTDFGQLRLVSGEITESNDTK